MKKIKIIIIFFIILNLLYFSCDSNNGSNFNLTKKGKNIILYNNIIPENNINNILNFYDEIISKILTDNRITSEKIIDKNLSIIIVKDNFNELNLIDDRILKKVNKELPLNKIIDKKQLYNKIFLMNIDMIKGVFFSLDDVIVIKYNLGNKKENQDRDSIILLLSEFNHYFISKNLERNFGKEYLDYSTGSVYNNEIYKIKKLIDEAITHFYILYYRTFFDSKLISSINNILKIDTSFESNHILGFYSQYLDTIYDNKKIPGLKTFFYGGIDFQSLSIYYYALMVALTKRYGVEIISKFIRFVYFSKYNSMEDITSNILNLTEDEFYKIWENIVVDGVY